MKDPSQRTKVVIRHLPPSLLQSDLFLHIDASFSGRYNWSYFRPGRTSQKQQRYSRAYIDFKRPEDVFEFAEFFDGHVFVNEKGVQHKAIVEYAPSQRVAKPCSRKDAREGTIYKDPDYLEFVKVIAQPVEHLPSAEIQLERKEAEQAGAPKEAPIVTPLMEFIRQKRAADNGAQGSLYTRKASRRRGAISEGKSRSSATKRVSEKKKYISKENVKGASRKDKSQFVVVSKQDDQQATSSGNFAFETVAGIEGSVSRIPLITDSGKKKIILLKGKGKDVSNAPESMPQAKDTASPLGKSPASTMPKQNLRREAGGKLIRSILLKNENRQSQSSTASQPLQKNQMLDSANQRRLPLFTNEQSGSNGHISNHEAKTLSSDGDTKKVPHDRFMKKDLHGLGEKQEKQTRNKDRPDRGVWAPLGRSNGQASGDHTSPMSQSTQSPSDKIEVSPGELKDDMRNGSRNMEATITASRRNSSVENGSSRQFGRRGTTHVTKDDGYLIEGKPPKRGVTGQNAHEKQVWIQKAPGS